MAAETTTHLSPSQARAISAAHGTTDESISSRVDAVAAALSAGVDVKTMAADLKAAAVRDAAIVPVVATVLGHAKAVVTVADKLGVTLTDMPVDVRATIYRAVQRHGVTAGVRDIVAAGIGGKTTAAKIERAGKAAAKAHRAAIEERAAKAADTIRTTADETPAPTADVLKGITQAIMGDRLVVTPDILRAVAALTEAVRAKAPRPAATPTPARVPSAQPVAA